MNFDFLKGFFDKLEPSFIIISIGVSAAWCLAIDNRIVVLILVFCCSYFLLISISNIKGYIIKAEQEKEKEKQLESEKNRRKNLIRRHFLSLNEFDFEFAKFLYKSEMPDKNDKLYRVLKYDEKYIRYQRINSYPYTINDDRYLQIDCISFTTTHSSIKVVFDPYFYELLENKVKQIEENAE